MMYEYRAKVINIVDGDTIDACVDMGFHMSALIRFRLTGVNCPETNRPESKADGLTAKAFTTSLLLNRDVLIKTSKADAFGRWLADIYLDGENFNGRLLAEGYAVPYRRN